MADALTDLHAALRAEAEACAELVEILSTEERALCAGDADAVETIVTRKTTQLQVVETLSRRRATLASTADVALTQTGVLAPASASREQEELAGCWNALRVVAARARSLNDRNGRLILRRQHHYESALAFLLRAAGRASGYDAQGRPAHGTSGRKLAAV